MEWRSGGSLLWSRRLVPPDHLVSLLPLLLCLVPLPRRGFPPCSLQFLLRIIASFTSFFDHIRRLPSGWLKREDPYRCSLLQILSYFSLETFLETSRPDLGVPPETQEYHLRARETLLIVSRLQEQGVRQKRQGKATRGGGRRPGARARAKLRTIQKARVPPPRLGLGGVRSNILNCFFEVFLLIGSLLLVESVLARNPQSPRITVF